MKTVIVFGATGQLGSRIAVRLQADGYAVVAVGHRASDNGFFAAHGIPYFSLDIACRAQFGQLPASGVYAVVHFAGMLPAMMSGYDAAPYVSSIVMGTLNVLDYARRSGADRIVFPQSLFDVRHLFGTPVPIPADAPRRAPLTGDHAVYVIAKNAAVDLIEHYHAAYGLRRFILRCSRVYLYHPNPYTFRDGKRVLVSDRLLIYRALRGDDIEVWGDPTRLLETCSVYDFLRIVECALRADCPGGLYNIGSGGTTLAERVRGIVDVFCPEGRRSRLIPRPDKPNGTQFVLDISKTVAELGYRPQCSWLEYCRRFKEEMQTQPFALLQGREADYYNWQL